MLLFLFLSFLSLFPSSLRNPVVHDRAPSARNVSVSCVRSQCRLTASDSNDAPETRGKKLIFQERVSREREKERGPCWRRTNRWSSGTNPGPFQKIRSGFLFHLDEEFHWQKRACTMPVRGGRQERQISMGEKRAEREREREGERGRKAREIKGFACR